MKIERHLLALALLVATTTAQADATLTYDRSGGDCATDFDRISVSGSRMRIDMSSFGMNMSSIYDGLEQMLVGLQHDEKTFSQMEMDDDAQDFQGDVAGALGTRTRKETEKARDEMAKAREEMAKNCKSQPGGCAALERMDGALAAMSGEGIDVEALMAQQERAMAQMDPKMLERAGVDPEAMRKQMEESRTALATMQRENALVHTPTDEVRTVAGLPCRVIEARLGKVVVERRCEAEPDAVPPLDPRDAKGFARGVARLNKMAQTWRPLGEQVAGDAMPDDTRKGLVAEKICYADDTGEEIGRATLKVQSGGVASDTFDVPAGYRPAGLFGAAE